MKVVIIFEQDLNPPLGLEKYRFTSASVFLLFRTEFKMNTCSYTVGKSQAPFSMAIGEQKWYYLKWNNPSGFQPI